MLIMKHTFYPQQQRSHVMIKWTQSYCIMCQAGKWSSLHHAYPANTKQLYSIYTMSGQRFRRV